MQRGCNLESEIYNFKFCAGVLAQLVERLNGIEEVTGSNPVGSTLHFSAHSVCPSAAKPQPNRPPTRRPPSNREFSQRRRGGKRGRGVCAARSVTDALLLRESPHDHLLRFFGHESNR